MPDNVTQDTLDLIRKAQNEPDDALAKAFTMSGTATSGLTYYDLEAPAKTLYPVITPLRNRIPRVTGGAGIQANWRAITAINNARAGAGISEGNRGAVIGTTVADYLAAFKGIGLDDYVTFEAEWAGRKFDDVKARAVEGLLRSLMIAEEEIILGGNNGIALGTTPTPAVADVTTGGTLAAATTYNVYCVALTLDGFLSSSVAGGVPVSATRTLADGTTEAYNKGSGQKSSVGSVTTASDGNATHCLRCTVTAVNGAVAYAWFWGTSGNELLGAITTINSLLATAVAGGTQNISTMPSADKSQNSLVYDGLLSQIMKTASGAYVATQATGTGGVGTPLTAGTDGEITEIETALKWFWDNLKLSPTDIFVSSQEQKNITTKILTGSASMAQRFVFQAQQGAIAGGVMVSGYLNRYAMGGAQEIPIRLHPYMPAGTMMFFTDQLPYPLSNVSSLIRMLCRQDYYQIEWPIQTRKYEYGVYADEVLQNYFPPAFGVIRNIANG
jgi:hypothetical protein